MSLIEGFWAESSPVDRRLLLDEAASRQSGRASFSFNTEDVLLDFDAGAATVTDVLAEARSETTSLRAFLDRAAAFHDDPTMGDGLDVLRRHPATFRVAPDGLAEPNA